MNKIDCIPKPVHPLHIYNTVTWKRVAPFYFNNRGVLTHRVKSAASHLNTDGSVRHSSVDYWCGNGCIADSGNFSDLIDCDISSVIVCERCEGIAVASGQPSTDELAKRHIHIGRAKAIRTCCSARL